MTTQRQLHLTQIITLVVMVSLLLSLAATPVLAQGGGGEIGTAITGIVTTITGIIQSVCVAAGVLGLSMWGIGKVARPVFPQLSALTQNYISDLMIGIAVVFVAATIV